MVSIRSIASDHNGYSHDDAGSHSLGSSNRDFAINQQRALFHSQNTKRPGSGFVVRSYPATVVLHLKNEVSAFLADLYADACCLRMAKAATRTGSPDEGFRFTSAPANAAIELKLPARVSKSR